MVLDAAQRAACVCGMPCRSGAVARESGAGDFAEVGRSGEHVGGEEMKRWVAQAVAFVMSAHRLKPVPRSTLLLVFLCPVFAADQATAPIRFVDTTAQSGIH